MSIHDTSMHVCACGTKCVFVCSSVYVRLKDRKAESALCVKFTGVHTAN